MISDIMQPTHLLFVLVIALLVLGPKRLPEVGRQLGNGIRDFRAAINGERREDEDEDEDDAVLAPAGTEPGVQDASQVPLAEHPVVGDTVERPATPAEHEFTDSAVESSTLPTDHVFADETVQQSVSPAEHELAPTSVERSTLPADHQLANETAEQPTAPIESAVAQNPSQPASGNGAAAGAPETGGDHSFATESSAPAEQSSDPVV